jgi:predicted transcriptional regulator
LTASDFFLWGYLKERVYVNKPQTIQELKENIQAETRHLRPETLCTVMENAVEKACICEQENGDLRDVVFHT